MARGRCSSRTTSWQLSWACATRHLAQQASLEIFVHPLSDIPGAHALACTSAQEGMHVCLTCHGPGRAPLESAVMLLAQLRVLLLRRPVARCCCNCHKSGLLDWGPVWC